MQKIALKEGGYLFSKENKNSNKQTKSDAKENKAAINEVRVKDYPVLGRLSARTVVVVVVGEV